MMYARDATNQVGGWKGVGSAEGWLGGRASLHAMSRALVVSCHAECALPPPPLAKPAVMRNVRPVRNYPDPFLHPSHPPVLLCTPTLPPVHFCGGVLPHRDLAMLRLLQFGIPPRVHGATYGGHAESQAVGV